MGEEGENLPGQAVDPSLNIVIDSDDSSLNEEGVERSTDVSGGRSVRFAEWARSSSRSSAMKSSRWIYLHTAAAQRKKKKAEDSASADQLSLRDLIYFTLSDPQFSLWAKAYCLLIIACVFMSVISLILFSYRAYSSQPSVELTLFILDAVLSGIFTVDYVVRLALCRKRLKFIIKPMNIIDLLSFVPFYIEIAVQGNTAILSILRIFRVARVFRLVQLGRASTVVRQFMYAVGSAVPSIVLLFVILALLVILFGAMMFYIETLFCKLDQDTLKYVYTSGDSAGEETLYQNIPVSMWWAIVTVTTVGYGDMFPVTWAGRLVAVATMVAAIVVLAFPVTILGSAFNDSYDLKTEEQLEKEKLKEPLGVRVSKWVRRLLRQREAKKNIDEVLEDYEQRVEMQELKGDDKAFFVAAMDDAEKWFTALEEVNEELFKQMKVVERETARISYLQTRVKMLTSVLDAKAEAVSEVTSSPEEGSMADKISEV
ncbi:hypothetical protein NDN08_002793 [Rhodosorus marinus]|uniref:Ion transport domain-containing protein n=1 Tax=Rhodosorus marinus TaxID=101924 RepID=A0AAV8UUR3_9RHOD|nr:hypothetical protein NDN08_002793 [Rhodosorus marinus]